MNTRFFATFTLAFFSIALVAGAVLSQLVLAQDNEASDAVVTDDARAEVDAERAELERRSKLKRKLERAERLDEKGKDNKALKVRSKAIITEYRAQRKYDRAQELKKKGKIKKYNKKIRKAARLGDEEAIDLLLKFEDEDDTNSSNMSAKADTLTKEMQGSRYSAKASLGNVSSLYRLGEAYYNGDAGASKNLSAAYAMFLHAEERGSGLASNRLLFLVPELSANDVALGRAVYKRWRSIIKVALREAEAAEDKSQ